MSKQRLPVWVNETRWRDATERGQLTAMLDLLRFQFAGVTVRKCCLCEIACTRRVADLFPDGIGHRAIELAARAVDDAEHRPTEEYAELLSQARRAHQEVLAGSDPKSLRAAEYNCAIHLLGLDPSPRELGDRAAQVLLLTNFSLWKVEDRRQLALVRDIFGNPFHPATFSPDWRTDTAVAIARGMYASRDFGAMPILADALQDAGCDDADILTYCRARDGVHVRGCWVVDLVLGKQ